MRFLQSECLGVQVTDLGKVRVRLRNVPVTMVHSVVDKKGILAGGNVVKTGHDKIFPNRLRGIAEVLCGSASLAVVDEVLATVRGRPEVLNERQHADLEIGNGTATHRCVSSRHQALASAVIRHLGDLAERQALLKSFVVPKNKKFVLLDRASQRSSKLIPFERWGVGSCVEEIPGIQSAVAQKLESAPVPIVGSRGGHDGDLTSSSFSIFSAIGVRQDVIFPDRIHSQQLPA